MDKYTSDRDGKSKTASGVDQEHYPEYHEAEKGHGHEHTNHELIAKRAHELWCARGCPYGSSEQDWLQAEAELRAGFSSVEPAQGIMPPDGSVQR